MLNKDAKKTSYKRLDVILEDSVISTKDASSECIISGYANTSTKDRVGDVVLPSAFAKSLPTFLKNPILLANHDWNDPIGVVLEATINDKGLFIKARISDTREDVKTLIREKCLRTFSIGYNEIDADMDESTKTKTISELELLEISVVTVPANHEAMFEVASSKQNSKYYSDLNSLIDGVTKTLGKDLESNEVAALCGFFFEHKGDEMKTKELIEQLMKAKNLPVTEAPKTEEAKAEPVADAPTADPMKDIMAKLDMIGQALGKVLEGMDKMNTSEATEDAPKNEGEAPVDEAKADESKPADQEKDEEDMSDEECAKHIADLEAELASLLNN